MTDIGSEDSERLGAKPRGLKFCLLRHLELARPRAEMTWVIPVRRALN